jgi:hypothetical protein
MPVSEITITEAPSGALEGSAYGQISRASTSTRLSPKVSIETTGWAAAYLSADDDPVLAKIWDNDEDAVYDSM